MNQRTLQQLSDLIAQHPRIRFQCFLAGLPSKQTFRSFDMHYATKPLSRKLLARMLAQKIAGGQLGRAAR